MRRLLLCLIPLVFLMGSCKDLASEIANDIIESSSIKSAEFDGDYDKIIVRYTSYPGKPSVKVEVYDSTNKLVATHKRQEFVLGKSKVTLTGDVPSGGYAEVLPATGNDKLSGSYTLHRN